jgi:hypothetical protein
MMLDEVAGRRFPCFVSWQLSAVKNSAGPEEDRLALPCERRTLPHFRTTTQKKSQNYR